MNHRLAYHSADEFLEIDPEKMTFQRFSLEQKSKSQPGWFAGLFQLFNDLNSVFVQVPFLPGRSPDDLLADFRFELHKVTDDSVDLLAHPVSDKARRLYKLWRVRLDRSDWSVKAIQKVDPARTCMVTFEFVEAQRESVPPLIPDLAGLHEPNAIR